MAIDTFWHESIVHKIGKVLFNQTSGMYVNTFCIEIIINADIAKANQKTWF